MGVPGAEYPWGATVYGDKGTLKMSVDQAVNKLNPLLTRVNPEYLVAELLYSNLTRLGVDMSGKLGSRVTFIARSAEPGRMLVRS